MAEVQFKTAVYLPGSVLMGMVEEIKAGVNWFVARALVKIVNYTQVSCGRETVLFHVIMKADGNLDLYFLVVCVCLRE